MVNLKMKNTENKNNIGYGFYSRVLEKPFDSVEELTKAEAAHFEKLKAKEDKAAQKKADATKVEEAFKALNAARKSYKEDLATITKEYNDSLEHLNKAFKLGKEDIRSKLAKAETTYSEALKEFSEKYNEGFHLTLKDGDFETTISGQSVNDTAKTSIDYAKLSDIFDLMFNF
jgi:chromosome segregation ATPase